MPPTLRVAARVRAAALSAATGIALGLIACAPAAAEVASFDGGSPSSAAADGHAAFKRGLPSATGPARSASRRDRIVAPSLTSSGDHLTVLGAFGNATISKRAADGFTLDTPAGALRIAPAWTDPAAPASATVDDLAALFPSLATEVDALLRPTAAGVTSVLRIRSALASETYSWTVAVPAQFLLRQLEDGGVAVVRAAGPSTSGPAQPTAALSIDDSDLTDAGEQFDDAEAASQRAARAPGGGEVLAVIAPPRAEDASGRGVPTALAVRGQTIELTVRHRRGPGQGGVFAELAATAPEALHRPWRELEGTGPVQPAADGLLKVRLDSGEVMLTHGGDPAEIDPSEGDDPLGEGLPAAPPDPNDEDGPIESAGTGPPYVCAYAPKQRSIRVLYAAPGAETEVGEDTIARIRRVMISANNKLYDESVASGGRSNPARLRFVCDKKDEITVTGVDVPRGDFATVVSRVKRASYTDRYLKYVVFSTLEQDGMCGEANQYPDDRLSRQNLANRGAYNEVVEGENVAEGTYAIAYGKRCWQTDVALHENAHTMGAVEDEAPDASKRGHCNDGMDVMCYDDRSPKDVDKGVPNTYSGDVCTLGPRGTRYDCEYDTYFDTHPEPGSWLDSHWNLGHPYNLALAFQAAPGYHEPFVFSGDDPTGGQGLYRALDGKVHSAKRSAGDSTAYLSALSPNAESVVYAQGDAANNCTDLVHARIDGSEPTMVFDCESWDRSANNPAFAGSNSKLVFDCHVRSGTESDICGMPLDDTPETIVGWEGLQFEPDEAGHRRLLAFSSTTTPSGEQASSFFLYSQIFITKRDGSQPVQFTSEPHFWQARDPKFSYDGTQVAFEGFVDGDENGPAVYVANIDGTGLRRVTNGFRAEDPTWTPDGDVVYTKYPDDGGPALLIREELSTGDTSELAPLLDWSSHASFRQAAYWQLDYFAPVPQPIP
jgi:hypothetical protein